MQAKPLNNESRPRSGDLLLDGKRILKLLWLCLRFGVFPLAQYFPFPYRKLSYPVRIRRVLEEMGLTYLKLGQFLALRFDVLPREVCQELNRLFEEVAPMPPEDARSVVESELQGRIEDLFLEFVPESLAAGSVAQVHRGRRKQGEQVVVKIQRLGIERIFKADIRNLRRITSLVDAFHLLGRLTAKGMLEEFAKWTLLEMDFKVEGQTADRLRREALSFEVIPRIFWDLTTSKVLTMEFIDGVSASELHDLLVKGGLEAVHQRLPTFEKEEALHRFTVISCWQLFVTGFFHGDPHPGNVLFLPDNSVAFIDFGIFGHINEEEREIVAGQIEHLAIGDIETSLRFYSRQLTPTEETDLEAFHRDALECLTRWYRSASDPNLPIEGRHLGRYTGEMIDVSRRNKMRYGLNYLLFWRALNNLNGTLWLVDPQFDMMTELRHFFERMRPSLEERATEVVTDSFWQRWLYEFATQFTKRTDAVFDQYESQGLSVNVRIAETSSGRRKSVSETRWIVTGILGVSFALFATAQSVTPAVRIGVIGVAFLFILYLRLRLRFR